MDIVRGTVRVVTRTANVTTSAAGAVGGAAIDGAIGGLQGAVSGIRNGVVNGSHSTPVAALTLGVVGAAGLVEWPLLLAVGGTALVVHQLSKRSDGQPAPTPAAPLRSETTGSGAPKRSTPRKSTPRKSTPRKSTASARRNSPLKASNGRRRSATRTS
jgi:hypothetical protein